MALCLGQSPCESEGTALLDPVFSKCCIVLEKSSQRHMFVCDYQHMTNDIDRCM